MTKEKVIEPAVGDIVSCRPASVFSEKVIELNELGFICEDWVINKKV